ncbi:MAG: ABC transporter permease [Nitriliruptoraceae bacterium]|nr:ABC transporter permease [Nitriliruptoraceae bacterium]
MIEPISTPPGRAERAAGAEDRRARLLRVMLFAALGVLLLSLVTRATGSTELTSAGTFGASVRLAVPILVAGLGGLFCERVGVINIGLEGMMILGTWFGAWGALTYGPWWGVLIGVLGGAIGGLLHALATVTFGIDQIVSGVAINILAAGIARFLSVIFFAGQGGGATQSARVPGQIARTTVPFLAGGELAGFDTPNLFGALNLSGIPVVAELGAIGLAVTANVSLLVLLCLALVPVTFLILWKTPLGLRLRSVGEHPVGAESLGVNVYLMKYLGVTVSGALAGLGGAVLVLEAAGVYREGQTGGRGFIALAALIFGNWRPGGVLIGAGLFGYATALDLRSGEAVHSLLLFVAIVLVIYGLVRVFRERTLLDGWPIIAGLVVWWAYLVTDSVPSQLVFTTPYVTTLVVLAFFSQRLRPPAAIGRPYRRGELG